MSILVTGATSGIGYFLVKLLREKDNKSEIRCLVRSEPPSHLKQFNLTFAQGDLTDTNSLVRALKGVETVYHIAGEARENMSASQYYAINHIGTRNLLEAFVKNNGKKFLHVSTVGVYGYKMRKEAVKEDAPKNLNHAYHGSKWLGEKEVFEYAKNHNFFAAAVRPPYIVGPRDRMMAPKLFDFLAKGKTIPLIRNGKAILSFVHHEDVARALIMCGESEKANGEAFNVSAGSITVLELFNTLGEIAGKEPKYMKLSFGLAYTLGLISELIAKITRSKPKITRRRVNQFSLSRFYDISKIEELVGFTPKYNVKEMLSDAYNWMKEVNLV